MLSVRYNPCMLSVRYNPCMLSVRYNPCMLSVRYNPCMLSVVMLIVVVPKQLLGYLLLALTILAGSLPKQWGTQPCSQILDQGSLTEGEGSVRLTSLC
jgi:hypothetical protein